MCKQLGQIFYGHSDITKVNLTMARLLTVVNERKKLRGEYRKHLEDQYIAEQKQKDHEEWLREREEKRARGEPVPMTPEEVAEMLKARAERKNEKMIAEKEKLMEVKDGGEATLAPGMTEEDLELLAMSKVKLS